LQLDTLGGDPLELLSYLGPSDDSEIPPTNSANQNNSLNANAACTTNEDILSLFES